MRTPIAATIAFSVLVAPGCAPVPPERAERDSVLLRAIEPCERQYPTIRVLGVDEHGRLQLQVSPRDMGDLARFQGCAQEAVRRTLRVAPLGAGQVASTGAPATVAIQLAGTAILVPVLVNGTSATLLLDTGATFTVIRPGLAHRAGIEVPSNAPKILGAVVGGRRLSIPYVRARSMRVGDAVVEGIDIGVFDALPHMPAIDGLLGGDFLNHFKVTVDRDQRRLTLEASRQAVATPPPPTAQAASGRVWPAPTWTAGDEWSFRWEGPTGKGTLVRTVEGEAEVDGVAHYVVRSGSRTLYYVKGDLGAHLEKADDAVVVRLTPPLAYAWPLQVGKTWESNYLREDPRASRTQQAYRKCAAVGEETVVVPAGTFVTLHVVCWNRAERVILESWYASEAKHWVRERILQASGPHTQDLVSYKVR